MIPELGNFALVLALALALIQIGFPTLGIWRQRADLIALAKPAALGQCFFLFISFGCLIYAFISNDFSVKYVAENSNSHLPIFYKVAAVWGAHEGSVLLWITILGLWSALVALFSKQLPAEMRARVLVVLGIVSGGFILFLITTSNPFIRFFPNFPPEGADLNPLLQDPGLVIHPPMLYMGYVGFSVAFAFAIAALWSGRLDAVWARWSRSWTIAAWCFLTLGIVMGSGWAYRVLGWGGWWFWDPVENASFLPWLTGTALIHSLIVCEKRGVFKSWTVLLAICAFSLSLIGTFLVRSGVLISVHAFATDPTRGAYLLKMLAFFIGGALLLYAFRAPAIRGSSRFSLLSRETMLLANNVLLMVIMATVLLGTLYPLIIDALGLGQISVGPPYFNSVFVPLILPVLFLMGVGPYCYWRDIQFKVLCKRLCYPFVGAIILALLLLLIIAGSVPPLVATGLGLALWIILATLQLLLLQIRQQKTFSMKHLGMIFAHLGIAVCVIGITLTVHYSLDRQVSMKIGDTVTVGAYNFQLFGFHNSPGPNYTGIAATFAVTRNDKFIAMLEPEKRVYTAQQTGTTKAAIDVGVFRDLYIALGDPISADNWAVRIYYKPFVRWIWFGGVLMFIGGLFSLYNISRRK